MKITFVGAGSTVFARNVLGDCMLVESLRESEMALYDIDGERLDESYLILEAMNRTINEGRARLTKYLGEDKRKAALKDADFVVTAIQVGGYEPATVVDFEVPKKYGLRQTIGDTLGIGGIFRALRSIPVFEGIARDIEEVAPRAQLLNYVNPMAMITGFLQRHTGAKTVGLCHSVQVCSSRLFERLGMEEYLEGRREVIAGINHMAWLLEIEDKNGKDLYPEIKKRALLKNESEIHNDMVRFEYIRRLGYYCTESSVHNAEYNNFFIKSKYPELIDRYGISLDEYPARCVRKIGKWKEEKEALMAPGAAKGHERSREYVSHIMDALATGKPYHFGGNVPNTGLIENLPAEACVEVPCLATGKGILPCYVGKLPLQLAAMNMTNINVQLLTIEAAHTLKKEHVYHAAMLDPHTSAELSLDDIVALCDDMIEAHGRWLPKYK